MRSNSARPGFTIRAGGSVFALLALVVLLAAALPARADAPRKTILVLASGLTLDDLAPGGKLDLVRQFAEEGGFALLNTAVSGQPTEAAAYLSVGSSERMAAPGDRGPRILEGGLERTLADLATEAYGVRGAEASAVSQGYRRRFGRYPPLRAAVVHLGVPALRAAQPSPSRAAQIGLLGEGLRRAGRRVAAYGDWSAALVGMDRRGAVWTGNVPVELGAKQIASILPKADVFILSASDERRLRVLTRAVAPIARRGAANVLIASVAPPLTPGGDRWARLGFVVAAGPSFPAGSLLTSPTTRTRGLVANIDLAPTVAALQGATLPGAGGRVLESVPSADPFREAARLDRQVTVGADATLPLMLGYGVFAVVAALLCALAVVWNRPALATAARFALLLAAAALPGMLLLGLSAPFRVRNYAVGFACVSALLAVTCELLGLLTRRSPLGLLFTATALVVAVDAAFGSPLVSRSLLSGYYLAGIRFYGIGNEYMGVLVGSALVGPALLAGPAPGWRYRMGAVALYVAALLALAVPAWGADAGGALAAAVTFTLAVFAFGGRRLNAGHVAAAFVAGFVTAAAVALADRLMPDAARSHIGEAVAAGQARGAGALWEIAARKVAMNARLTATPYTAAALAGLVPLWLLLARGRAGARVRDGLRRRPALARVLPAAGWGAFAAFAFNDSGIVAALLLLAPVTAAVIESMVCDTSP